MTEIRLVMWSEQNNVLGKPVTNHVWIEACSYPLDQGGRRHPKGWLFQDSLWE
jgi:hypothetical protein